jgi:hypothetical protein
MIIAEAAAAAATTQGVGRSGGVSVVSIPGIKDGRSHEEQRPYCYEIFKSLKNNVFKYNIPVIEDNILISLFSILRFIIREQEKKKIRIKREFEMFRRRTCSTQGKRTWSFLSSTPLETSTHRQMLLCCFHPQDYHQHLCSASLLSIIERTQDLLPSGSANILTLTYTVCRHRHRYDHR